MTYFTSIFSPTLLDEMIAEKYVRMVLHPTHPLALYSYTEKAAYERVWNDCTRACRGLILDAYGKVVARPFAKFFNVDEPDSAKFEAADEVLVANKFDGSLIIAYPLAGEKGIWSFATRGSFTSPQAMHAMAHMETVKNLFVSTEVTYLFEGIWPSNRIVLDYGPMDALVFLGAIDNRTGKTCGPLAHSVAFEGETMTYAEALSLPPRRNAEGYVITKVATDERIKLKQADYCALHRIITQCTARTLWEYLAVNALMFDHGDKVPSLIQMSSERFQEICAVGPDWKSHLTRAGMPPAFTKWVDRRTFELEQAAIQLHCSIEDDYMVTVQGNPGASRGQLAASWAKHPHRGALFARLDRKPVSPYCWKAVYPAHELPFASNE